jgi:glycosyltransferase involved in cell wall biosynthesis
MQKKEGPIILMMSTYPPRECGIATFTKDLSDSINKQVSPQMCTKILAINKEESNHYNYPDKVIFQISENNVDDYLNVAKKINNNENIKLVSIQHEFGLFGGEYGDYLLAFLEVLTKPVVITFHSVLPNPDDRLRKVVQSISEKVDEIVVMTKKGCEILENDYGLRSDVKIIPHGIPIVNFENQEFEKKELRFDGKKIISSFGLMSSGKGYEYVIDAMPDLIKDHPDLLYLIVGETHPVVRKNEGEKYRNFLEKKVRNLNLQKHVKFHDKYLSLLEIIKYLKATDIYISSGLNPNQITSGTLVYAMGCGRTIVSTPFLHAKDCITNDIGKLVMFKNSDSYKKSINEILNNSEKRKEMELNAYRKSRKMTWPNVALAYKGLFNEVLNIPEISTLPLINVDHLYRLTDSFGIIQFANQHIPDTNSGYSLDDNARALVVSTTHYSHFKEFKMLKLVKIYLDYLKYVQGVDGKLYNYVDINRKINSVDFSEDAHGRAVWSIGFMLKNKSIPEDLKKEGAELLKKSIPVIMNLQSPRAIAFSLIGLCYTQESNLIEVRDQIKKLADWLVSAYKVNSHDNWHWFEPYLTYSNSKLPESLLLAHSILSNDEYLKIGEYTLHFLINQTFDRSTFIPIGQDGWYIKGKERAYFDQQPVEASYMVQTLITAFNISGNNYYRKYSHDAFLWFLGNNSSKQVIYNESTGGCYDGLGRETVNINQGAESSLSYLMARLSLIGI